MCLRREEKREMMDAGIINEGVVKEKEREKRPEIDRQTLIYI